ncbi:hypothetical protein RclHR1_02250009 [Rhizophagus clarus]|uniref:Uncharacterized protein n=1 Tax=Rhizophagus clarus TaxID=94130 RepID=A0A2Z6R7X2_9GLOM|nr:hypothetical protein RclHR1_02250009 [Rhizophagus clarus]
MLKNSPGLSTSKGLELHFEVDHKVQNSFRGGLYDISKVWKSFIGGLLSRTPLGADYNILKSGTPLEADYDILKVWKSFIGGLLSRTPLGADYNILKSGTPLEADYDILKIQTFHFEDWTLFEDLVTIFEDYFEGPDEAQTPFKDPGRQNTVHLLKVRSWIPRRNFEGLGLPGTLQNFEGALQSLQLLDEDFKGLQFSLGAIIFSRFDVFCWIEKVKSCLLESNQLEQCPNH